MVQTNGLKDASQERCVRRVKFGIARAIRHGHLAEGEILTPESLVRQRLIQRDDIRYAIDALDDLTASPSDMLDHVFAYSYVVKRRSFRR